MGKGFRDFLCCYVMTIKTTISTTEKSPKIPKSFFCVGCDYTTCNKKDYSKHLLTVKHINNASPVDNPQKSPKLRPKQENYVCDICEKIHKDRAGLWRHKKKCSQINTLKEELETPKQIFTNDLVITLINQNKELQNLLIEDRKIFMEDRKCSQNTISNSNNNTNINSNNSFNLNFFLNEQCKNAINLVDFIDSLQVGVKDLERTGKLGYVEGISQIFLNGLKELDIYNRPIHCTDLHLWTFKSPDFRRFISHKGNVT